MDSRVKLEGRIDNVLAEGIVALCLVLRGHRNGAEEAKQLKSIFLPLNCVSLFCV